mgnify:CR=1 FL=1
MKLGSPSLGFTRTDRDAVFTAEPNEEGSSIIPSLVTLAGIAYFGYEVNRRRDRLRRIFSCFDKEESVISQTLEELVQSGRLKPYMPGHSE